LIQRLLLAIAAAAAVAAAAGVLVVALAFALYALMRDAVGPAGAAAVVAGAAALLMVTLGVILAAMAGAFHRQPRLHERVASFVKEKPLTAAAAALAAGVVAFRNPKVLMAVALSFLEPKGGRRA